MPRPLPRSLAWSLALQLISDAAFRRWHLPLIPAAEPDERTRAPTQPQK
jgi:hypothetical protein